MPRRSPTRLFVFIALLLAIVVAGGVWFVTRGPVLAAWLVGVNLSTFLLYAYDKSIAGGSATRVPEVVLHLAALLGGTPAALVGQVVLRHKTQKQPFRTIFMIIFAGQIVGMGLLWFWMR